MGKSNMPYWIVWIALSSALALFLYSMLQGGLDSHAMMPGPLSDGHHQLSDNCQACHSEPLGGGQVLQDACMNCHGDLRQKPFDSHPQAKFKDPRNADLLAEINALECITCHSEHKTEITAKDGLTQPVDFCVHCHADIADERPSHKDMDFMTCKDSGCHNFHNNRAIYTDFLVKHLDKPAHLERAQVKSREFADVLSDLMEYPHSDYPQQSLGLEQADHPKTVSPDEALMNDWLETRHAAAGVNCSACHQPRIAGQAQAQWEDRPEETACALCHNLEVDRFKLGKHGMRTAVQLPNLKVSSARLPMDPAAGHQELSCNSCHGGHRFDVQYAAVDGCLQCHADEHSLAYRDSPHAQLWEDEISAQAPANSGVSCATCHMPRIDFDVNDWISRVMVDHNQSHNLSPNSKMLRDSCLHCHGLDFSLKALADPGQIITNFAHPPGEEEHPSMQLARRDNERYLRETAESGSQ